jgi:hypothetical protein
MQHLAIDVNVNIPRDAAALPHSRATKSRGDVGYAAVPFPLETTTLSSKRFLLLPDHRLNASMLLSQMDGYMVVRARRSGVDHSLGMGEAPGSNPGESTIIAASGSEPQ